jgi:hypothetical protein
MGSTKTPGREFDIPRTALIEDHQFVIPPDQRLSPLFTKDCTLRARGWR